MTWRRISPRPAQAQGVISLEGGRGLGGLQERWHCYHSIVVFRRIIVLDRISDDASVQDMIPHAHYYVRRYTSNSFNRESLGLTHMHIEYDISSSK